MNRLGELHQIHNFGAFGDKDELITFWCQKVRDQGHGKTTDLVHIIYSPSNKYNMC